MHTHVAVAVLTAGYEGRIRYDIAFQISVKFMQSEILFYCVFIYPIVLKFSSPIVILQNNNYYQIVSLKIYIY